ncbi:hypothetical protein SAMN04489740_2741 [Arthrobacter alpinus]|uniref:Uncharacterized protein n=1 Tax=Arthrobacter alpinus TaxID=656366 RepID=A0A1H5M6J1_9MICC|nr:hypothetical protein SAMN04489740_2741 [Arthrobacter alpinus]
MGKLAGRRKGAEVDHAPFKLLRTTLVGSTILGLAAGAHLLAGGTLPAWPVMAAIVALHIMFSTIVTKFRLTLPTMLGLLAGSQVVLHKGFDVLSHSAHLMPGAVTNSGSAQTLGHHTLSPEAHASAMLTQATSTGASGLETIGHASAMSGWMLAAHIVATLAAAGLLAYGENALWSLARWLRPLYRRAAVVLLQPAPSAPAGVIPRPLPRLPWRNIRPDTRRGPPVRTAIFA